MNNKFKKHLKYSIIIFVIANALLILYIQNNSRANGVRLYANYNV